MKQYGLMPYCVLHLSVLQYIAILQYFIDFGKKSFHMGKWVLAVKKRIYTLYNCIKHEKMKCIIQVFRGLVFFVV